MTFDPKNPKQVFAVQSSDGSLTFGAKIVIAAFVMLAVMGLYKILH